MKNNLLYYFIKEEIRLHISLTNSKNYYSYPFMLILFFSSMTIFANYFFKSFNINAISIYIINILFIGGIMSGSFGLYARDFLERKFGDVGKLFQNSQIQPIKLSKIFLLTALSDIFFYLFWFIIPVMAGFAIGLLIMKNNINFIFFLAISSISSFITGLLLIFTLSVIYQRSKTLFSLITITIISTITYLILKSKISIISPFHNFYLTHSFIYFLLSFLVIIFLSTLAYFSVGREYKTSIKKIEKKRSFKFYKKISPYLTKDFIDMRRTGDLFAKPLFNVFIPSVLVLIMFVNSNLNEFINLGILFFSIIIGTLGVQMLNSLINSDSVAYYKHLPIKLKDFIKPKIILSTIICFIESIVILLIYAYYMKNFSLIFQALIITLALLIYNFNLSFYLTGLNPNENLMHSKTFIIYFLLLTPILILIVLLNILFSNSIYYMLLFLIFSILISKLYFYLGIKKWDITE